MSKARYTITIKSRTGDVVFEKEMNAMIGAVADGTAVTGITLPFLSYGGSSMVTSMTALGFVLSVSARQKMINF